MPSLSDPILENLRPTRGKRDPGKLAQDKELDKLLKRVVAAVKEYAEDQIKHIRQSARIGLALSGQTDIDKLLEMIVDETRALTKAEGGTLYIVSKEEEKLSFRIIQNDVLGIRMGGTSCVDIELPAVPLKLDGQPNCTNVSSYVALTGETINIADVYEAEGFDFSGPRKYDKKTGYRSKSMLVIPLKNHKNDIIGVLQLLNAKDPDTGEPVPFQQEYVYLIESLASQAAVALTNTQLIRDLKKAFVTIKNLFDAFIKSIATAIDEKSPYTAGHIKRVVDLTMMIAEEVNRMDEGPFKDIRFDNDAMEELRLAAWMHDIGKITTPEYVLDKSKKLQAVYLAEKDSKVISECDGMVVAGSTIFDRIQVLETRFQLIESLVDNEYLEKRVRLLELGGGNPDVLEKMETERLAKKNFLVEDLEFIRRCNSPSEFMTDEKMDRLKSISEKEYTLNGETLPYLFPDEVEHLSVRKGTLTEKERKVIENHAVMTLRMLRELPFPENLSKVPEYASEHHERPDGSGYPFGLSGEQLPLQPRIMALADIFEALTAKDRPYKGPMKLSQAMKILEKMKEDGHTDENLYDLFVKARLYSQYAQRELNPEQIDDPDVAT